MDLNALREKDKEKRKKKKNLVLCARLTLILGRMGDVVVFSHHSLQLAGTCVLNNFLISLILIAGFSSPVLFLILQL